MPDRQRPTVVALAVVRREDRIFIGERRDPATGERFYRPLGGTVEFQERAADAAIREFEEEAGARITGLRYLGTLEARFAYAGASEHQIVLAYEADFADPAMYRRAEVPRKDRDAVARWVPLADLGAEDAPPVYPAGLLDLLLGRPLPADAAP